MGAKVSWRTGSLLLLHLDDGRPNVETPCECVDRLDPVTKHLLHGRKCALVDQWTNERIGLSWIPNLHLREGLLEPLHQFVGHALVNNETPE